LDRLLLHKIAVDGLLEEVIGASRYYVTPQGREQAVRLLEVCGYIGPAPVALETYTEMLHWQFANTPEVLPEHVVEALSGLVVSPEAAQLAGLAVSSGSSLFVFGPPGNGKSSLGRQIPAALRGDFWIPHCISVGS